MEENKQHLSGGDVELQLDDATKLEFDNTAKWMRNGAIVFFGVLGLALLFLFIVGKKLFEASGLLGGSRLDDQFTVILVVFVVILVIVGIWTYLLLSAGSKIRDGLRRNDMATFNTGISHAKTYFIIYMVFLALTIITNLTKL
jgi:hypothetical protein